jgi:phosphoglucomutase
MTLDHDGKIRMDCSSPYAMASLIKLKDQFDIAFGNDPDADRHGIVTHSVGLLNPNHFLSVAVWYFFQHRPGWRSDAAIGKTLVSVRCSIGWPHHWAQVGKCRGLQVVRRRRSMAISVSATKRARASFLRKRTSGQRTRRPILDLLAEITAVTGRDPGEHYKDLEAKFGRSVYERMDAVATPAQKAVLGNLSAEMVEAKEMAGEVIVAKLTHAPSNGAAIGGLKVVTENGWFAARPSGTEDIYKIYAESFKDAAHLKAIQAEAQMIVSAALKQAGV